MLVAALSKRRFVQYFLGATAFVLFAGYLHTRHPSLFRRFNYISTSTHCSDLPGADDTVVIFKTGATEFDARATVHFNTTFQCYKHLILFSDHVEEYSGLTIHDAIADVSPKYAEKYPEFELYRHIKTVGRAGIDPQWINKALTSDDWKGDLIAWQLDKWKFLPLLNQTYHRYPDKKWYFLTEADTGFFWSTLLRWQHQLDHTRPYYLGAATAIGEMLFAHGGSGTLISRPALESVVRYFSAHQDDVEKFTGEQWAGDCVMGKILLDSGTPLTWADPITNGKTITDFHWVDETKQKPNWCYPSLTYHHMVPNAIEEMWRFEQEWFARGGWNKGDGFLRQRDVFLDYVMPMMKEPKTEWNNACPDENAGVETLEGCEIICRENLQCLQWRFDGQSKACTTSTTPQLGVKAEGTSFHSGWLYDRVQAWTERQPACWGPQWIT